MKGHEMFRSAIAVSVALLMTGCLKPNSVEVTKAFAGYIYFGDVDDDAAAIFVAPISQPGRYSAIVTYNGEQRQGFLRVEGENLVLVEDLVVEDVDLTVLLERIRRVVEGVDDEFLPVVINYFPDADLEAALKGLAEELVGVVVIRQTRLFGGVCPACGYDLRHGEHEACPECGVTA